MAEKKMTRKDALEFALQCIEQYELEYAEDNTAEQAKAVIGKMLVSIKKQSSRPKGKTTARLENEKIASEFIPKLQEHGEPVNTKWMMEHLKFCLSSQKAVAVAKVAEEWGEIKTVTIKNRTFYAPADWEPTE